MFELFKWMVCATTLIAHLKLCESAATPKGLIKWKDNQIYFTFTKQFDERRMKVIRNAIKELENIVCVKITEITDVTWKTKSGRKPVQIIDANECWSNVGKKKISKLTKVMHPDKSIQELSLSKGCISDSTVKHEFMHLLGFEHEQSRSDRDEYIDLNDNIIKDPIQFKVKNTINYGPFDFQSNMLYAPWEMSKKPGRPTWIVKKGQSKYDKVLDQGSISWLDAKALNQMYECGKNCKTKCAADEYLNAACQCISADKFAEDQCFDTRTDCKLYLHFCRTDDLLTSECRKTCKTCYKSPSGRGERGTIEVCDDSTKWMNGFCQAISAYKQDDIDMHCESRSAQFYCRKTCKSGCLRIEIPEIVDECQDLRPDCVYSDYDCEYTPMTRSHCAKTCKLCS